MLNSKLFVFLFLLLGIPCWLFLGNGIWGNRNELIGLGLTVVIAAALSVAIPSHWIRSARRMPWNRYARALVTSAFAAVIFYGYATYYRYSTTPAIADEQCYVIQARTVLQEGRPWLPKHELGEAFGAVYMILDPVYASKYPPLTSILFAVGFKAGVPPWVVTLILSALAVGLFQLILSELFDDLCGMIGAAALIFLPLMASWSLLQMSHPVMLFLGLLMFFLFLRWWAKPSVWRTALLGVVTGLAFLTRPYDTFLFCAVLGAAGVYRMGSVGFRALCGRVAVVSLAFLPFFVVQLVCNKGITGHYGTMPWSHYTNQNDPYDDISIREIAPSEEPTLDLPPKIKTLKYSKEDYLEKIHTNPGIRLRDFGGYFVRNSLPHPFLALLLPVGLLGLRGLRFPAVCLCVAEVIGYSFHTIYCGHYAMPVAPFFLLLLTASATVLSRGFGEKVKLFTLVVVLLPSVFLAPRLWNTGKTLLLDQTNTILATEVKEPAVVFFECKPDGIELFMPVYNTDVAWPDDAKMVRVYWRSPEQNRKVCEYYARTQPHRKAYRYDTSGRVTFLGNVVDLAR